MKFVLTKLCTAPKWHSKKLKILIEVGKYSKIFSRGILLYVIHIAHIESVWHHFCDTTVFRAGIRVLGTGGGQCGIVICALRLLLLCVDVIVVMFVLFVVWFWLFCILAHFIFFFFTGKKDTNTLSAKKFKTICGHARAWLENGVYRLRLA